MALEAGLATFMTFISSKIGMGESEKVAELLDLGCAQNVQTERNKTVPNVTDVNALVSWV